MCHRRVRGPLSACHLCRGLGSFYVVPFSSLNFSHLPYCLFFFLPLALLPSRSLSLARAFCQGLFRRKRVDSSPEAIRAMGLSVLRPPRRPADPPAAALASSDSLLGVKGASDLSSCSRRLSSMHILYSRRPRQHSEDKSGSWLLCPHCFSA